MTATSKPKPERRPILTLKSKTIKKPEPKKPEEKPKTKPDIDQLRERWPTLFNDDRRPLAIGIYKVLRAELTDKALPVAWLKVAIGYWVRNKKYMKQVAAGGSRYNLQGEPEGTITEEQKTGANAWINHKKKRDETKHPAIQEPVQLKE